MVRQHGEPRRRTPRYFTKFVNGYKGMGINIEVVSPQNEPGYDQNYPSCLWDSATYVTFIKSYLGPAMMPLGVKVMLGTMSNAGDANRNDINIATAVLADATAKSFVSVAGVQWGVLERVNMRPVVRGPAHLGHRAQVRQLPVESQHGLRRDDLVLPRLQHVDGPQRPRLRRGELDLPPKRDQQGQGHGLQRLEHGAQPERPGQRHVPSTGDRTPSW